MQPRSYNFYELLCCPACRGDLDQQETLAELHCPSCEFTFPISDGIPILFPCDVKAKADDLFGRYWDSEEQAELYDSNVEGGGKVFGIYNHNAEIYGLTCYYNQQNLDIILDAGCGNGRFSETLPPETIKIGIDASLNLLKIAKRRNRADFLVCGELEHLPFKDEIFGTVYSCRVLQHLHEQEKAVTEMARVVREDGDVILELYNTWNLKTVYKNIRMSPTLRRIFNAPFRMLFNSMSPFNAWGLSYDQYNNWFEVKRWMRKADLHDLVGRGVGFGYHKYLFLPFYVDALLSRKAPKLQSWYYDVCFRVEQKIGPLVPFRFLMEKFVLKGSKNTSQKDRTTATKIADKLRYTYKSSNSYNAAAIKETKREVLQTGILVKDNQFHLLEAIEWLKRAQDATPDRGVARGYSVGWTSYLNTRGWQPSYPETTGYIIPTFFECAEYLQDVDLETRAIEMADWEIDVQMDCGAVMGGTVDRIPTPAVFNTGQVMLGWLCTNGHTKEQEYIAASEKAAHFLIGIQAKDGAWYKGNSVFANQSHTTYNSRVGWALIIYGRKIDNSAYVEAGQRNIEYTVSRQRSNGWFEDNCLSDPSAPLLHTICYAIEGLLGAYNEIGNEDYLERTLLAADHLIQCIREDGSTPGRLDQDWQGTVEWSCLTGSAQLSCVLLRLFAITHEKKYQAAARRVLSFLKSTQNCVADDPGLRGGIKGSHPFDGAYGQYQVLNWATKFYADALLLDEKLS